VLPDGVDGEELSRIAEGVMLARDLINTPANDMGPDDLEAAALSLRPDIGEALGALRAAGAPVAIVSGSGPTAVGLFPDLAAAERAAESLDRDEAIVCAAGRARLAP